MIEPYYLGGNRWMVSFWGLSLADFHRIDEWCWKTWGEPNTVALSEEGESTYWYGVDNGWIVGSIDQATMLELTWNLEYRS